MDFNFLGLHLGASDWRHPDVLRQRPCSDAVFALASQSQEDEYGFAVLQVLP